MWATRDTVFPRYLAALIDNLAVAVLGVIAAKQLDDDWIVAQVAVFIAVVLAYFFIFEWLFASTPAKMWTGLVVVDLQGRRCSWRQSLIRTLWRMVEINPVLLGGIPAAVSVVAAANHQRFGDRFAKTLVIPRRRMRK